MIVAIFQWLIFSCRREARREWRDDLILRRAARSTINSDLTIERASTE
jgi:hypothetical protein